MNLAGIAFSGFRSFTTMQNFAPLNQINLLVGQNNSGKSNALTYISKIYNLDTANMLDEDFPFGDQAVNQKIELALRVDDPLVVDLMSTMDMKMNSGVGTEVIKDVIAALKKSPTDSVFWIPRVRQAGVNPEWPVDLVALREAVEGKPISDYVNNIASHLGTATNGSKVTSVETIVKRFGIPDRELRAYVIPAFRQIRSGEQLNNLPDIFDGAGLIPRLHALKEARTPRERAINSPKFRAINDFVKSVLDDSTAELQIPYDSNSLHITRGGEAFDLNQLGSGVHELIIIAAASTVIERSIICLEEPEIHLHPTLQRRLVQYLADQTDNTYFISTHSAHFLDQVAASIFHLTNDGSGTQLQAAITSDGLGSLCDDLGYRPSDILQANCVIWVEGPSDRIYLITWLRLLYPHLVEGIDFSIMFYGGRLLSHLSGADDESDLVQLRRLNRYMVVLMDSDKRKEDQPLSKSKERMITELKDRPDSFAWVTEGYTIENYIPKGILAQAVKDAHRELELTWSGALYEPPLGPTEDGSSFNKVAVSRKASVLLDQDHIAAGSHLREALTRVLDVISRASRAHTPSVVEPVVPGDAR